MVCSFLFVLLSVGCCGCFFDLVVLCHGCFVVVCAVCEEQLGLEGFVLVCLWLCVLSMVWLVLCFRVLCV